MSAQVMQIIMTVRKSEDVLKETFIMVLGNIGQQPKRLMPVNVPRMPKA
jgi:hypothetical protein